MTALFVYRAGSRYVFERKDKQLLGNWRLKSTEPIQIRALNNVAHPNNGLFDQALANGKSRPRVLKAVKYQRPNRPKNRKELQNG